MEYIVRSDFQSKLTTYLGMDNFLVISYARYGDFRMKALTVLLTLAAAGMAIGAPQGFGQFLGFGQDRLHGFSGPQQNDDIIEFCQGWDCSDDGDCTGPNCQSFGCGGENCNSNDAWNAHCGFNTNCHVKRRRQTGISCSGFPC